MHVPHERHQGAEGAVLLRVVARVQHSLLVGLGSAYAHILIMYLEK